MINKCQCGSIFITTGSVVGNVVNLCGNCKEWYFEDGKINNSENYSKLICPICNLSPTKEGHDPCIANLPKVAFACCGHGDKKQAYVMFDKDECVVIREDEALEYIKEHQLKQKDQD